MNRVASTSSRAAEFGCQRGIPRPGTGLYGPFLPGCLCQFRKRGGARLYRQWPRVMVAAHAPGNEGIDYMDASSLVAGTVGILFSLADAAGIDATDVVEQAQGDSGFLAPISNSLESVLKTLQGGLAAVNVPYSYGFAIILLTVLVKIVTYPFTKKQVESSIAMQNLKPRIDNIKLRYGDDKDKVQRETSILYEEAGVDPTAGCFPSLATIPILWGLYRTLSNVATEGLLDSEGFFWIPTLGGPTTIADRQSGSGISWLFPFENGAPPIGWDEAAPYLVLPFLLVVCQYISSSIIQPPVDPNAEDNSQQWVQYLVKALPLLVGYFSLTLPSGLSLYYFSNIVITSGQQIYLRKGGGADVEVNDLGPVTKLGMGRKTGEDVLEMPPLPAVLIAKENAQAAESSEAASPNGTEGATSENGNGSAPEPTQSAAVASALMSRSRCKRKRLEKKVVEIKDSSLANTNQEDKSPVQQGT